MSAETILHPFNPCLKEAAALGSRHRRADFGRMGTLTQKQRKILIDVLTETVMHGPYGLKCTVMQVEVMH